ncbi:hypothetical protein O181_002505 [Austropuccinia psidii MF-1]|uniref:Uncharacterized protein n=1 Tax=Austropuccinia psidii MF-1 TaxID=1389203 RepID=A0A9Q3GCX5_9BASI|nr:hypothetical protein [Austropuccinia psidii MF-1]
MLESDLKNNPLNDLGTDGRAGCALVMAEECQQDSRSQPGSRGKEQEICAMWLQGLPEAYHTIKKLFTNQQ